MEAQAAQTCPIRFQGQWEDSETGLYYNRFRYYDPLAAQYVSSDPLGLAGGLRSNGYVFNPIVWIDPFGLTDEQAIQAAANRLTTLSKSKKGAVGGLAFQNGVTFSGVSGKINPNRDIHPIVTSIYDSIPKDQRGQFHGKCCELDTLSQFARSVDFPVKEIGNYS